MRITIIAQHFSPEDVSGAILATELATDLVRLGHEVNFVTCAPNYPKGKLFPGYRNSFLAKETVDGVKVIRTWSYISPLKTSFSRIINWLTFSLSAVIGGISAGKPDVILSYAPPITLGFPAILLSRIWSIPWILRVEDLYPDAAIAVGALRNSLLIQISYIIEKFIYKKANYISLISEGFKDILIKKGISTEKLSVTPAWADPKEVYPLPKENDFRKRHKLTGKFILLYAGNLGTTSSLEELISVAFLLRNQHDIKIIIVGEGVKKIGLEDQAANQNLANVKFLPFQPRLQYAEMMSAADVGLVTLNNDSSPYSLPSKIFNIMASGRPILAIVPEESEVALLITTYQCGWVVSPSRPSAIVEKILQIKSQKDNCKKYGDNGRRALEDKFSRDICVSQFERRMKEVICDRN